MGIPEMNSWPWLTGRTREARGQPWGLAPSGAGVLEGEFLHGHLGLRWVFRDSSSAGHRHQSGAGRSLGRC